VGTLVGAWILASGGRVLRFDLCQDVLNSHASWAARRGSIRFPPMDGALIYTKPTPKRFLGFPKPLARCLDVCWLDWVSL
jgi:hypothetical protein